MNFAPTLIATTAAALAKPDVRRVHEWAADNLILPMGGYAIPGRFDVNRSRHLIDILDAVQSRTIRQVNILKAVQSGGTLAADVSVAWLLANNPGPTMWNFPDDPLAKQHAKTRLMPMLKASPAFRSLLPDNRHDMTQSEITFSNGVPFIVQAGTLGRLQGRSIRYMVNDECWEWDAGMLKEADARLSAYRRFEMEKVINISQAGEVGSEWYRLCNAPGTEFREWRSPCRGCGALHSITPEVIRGGERVRTLIWDTDGSNARWICPDCKHEERDSAGLRSYYNESGRYVADAPLANPSAVTFRWNAFGWHPWDGLIADYREAIDSKKLGDVVPLKKFLQKQLAEFWEDDAGLPVIMPATFDNETPDDATPGAVRFLTLDTQIDHLWACVREWKPDGDSRLLYWGKVESFSDADDIAERFGVSRGDWPAVVKWQNTVPRSARPPSKPSGVFIDTGGNRTQEVYDACWQFGWIGTKGTDREHYTHKIMVAPTKYAEAPLLYKQIGSMVNYESRGSCLPLLIVAASGCKNILANLRDGKGARWEVPKDIGTGYIKQINSEVRVSMKGRWRWLQSGSRANHAWDCEVLQVLAASMRGILAKRKPTEVKTETAAACPT